MKLSALITNRFGSGVCRRGETYFRQNRVRLTECEPTWVLATVRGSQPYAVNLQLDGAKLVASCTCPYYSDVGLCKHIWAALRAAESRHCLEVSRTGPVDVVLASRPGDETPHTVAHAHDAEEEPPADDGNEAPVARRRVPAPSRIDPLIQPLVRDLKEVRIRPNPIPRSPAPPHWQQVLEQVRIHTPTPDPVQPSAASLGAIAYRIDMAIGGARHGLRLQVFHRKPRKKTGELGRLQNCRIAVDQIGALPDAADRHILTVLLGAHPTYAYSPGITTNPGYDLPAPLQAMLLPRLCATGRLHVRLTTGDTSPPLQWDAGPPWELRLVLAPVEGKPAQFTLRGVLQRGEEQQSLDAPVLLVAGGWVFWPDRVAALIDHGAFAWIDTLRAHPELRIPKKQGDDLLQAMLTTVCLPPLDVPAELRYETVSRPPQPHLKVFRPQHQPGWGEEKLWARLSFDYDGRMMADNDPATGFFQTDPRRFVPRDEPLEQAARTRLHELGVRPLRYWSDPQYQYELPARLLPRTVAALMQANWKVEASGKIYRLPGAFELHVTSGVDWFELRGHFDFDGARAELPRLLAALRKGETTVTLDDGSLGVLPEAWLAKYAPLAEMGAAQGDHLRFRRSQAMVLDALLAAQPEATCDEVFRRVREELHRFEAIAPAAAPRGFQGQLRGYQQEGLGWLYFLQRFGFGGCLADDMGLGKTVQVLALLEARRDQPVTPGAAVPPRGPSLVVAPRSLIFNWKLEAARFTPRLRILDHTGTARNRGIDHLGDYDLVLTTYGTLRRDAAVLKDVPFDYVILDEAQAIKNAESAAAKAARLLQGRHRLALSGTPVQNHLGELWSLFEFLNPGMLGAARVFQNRASRDPDEATRALLARALRPFLLRRTKAQVAPELPDKLEETLYCELEPPQRKLYNELRAHFRDSILARVERDGINRSKIQILEALLRLRQAACHPGLIDKTRVDESSAKLDALLPQLLEVQEENHKTLVFSQFTSLLAIVRRRLDAEGITYEYLDGQTRDRQAPVERFQTDPDCRLFLISLKAGGLGLNLTAAEYVFLLDPWWNPAVEAQAIDRAHRIGQTRKVFAYRLIARDTVEEKVLLLQQSKRALADAIINADNSLIRTLGREDLELLLG